MTIATTSSSVTYQGNGAATQFPFTFTVQAFAYLQVILTDNSQSPAIVTILAPTQFSATGIGNTAGGAVLYPLSGPALTVNQAITLRRVVPYVQGTSIVNQGGFYPDVIEAAFDYATMEAQQLADGLSRAVQVPVGSGLDPSAYLPTIQAAEVAAANAAQTATNAAGAATGSASTAATQAGVAIAQATSAAASAATAAATNNINAATIASLRAIAFGILADRTVAHVRGYYTDGDGGGGAFIWTAASTATDDGGVTINPTGNIGAGRWLRWVLWEVSDKMFGAKVDGATDDAAAVNGATAWAIANKAPLHLVRGTRVMKSTWNCTAPSSALTTSNDGFTAYGDGISNSIISFNFATPNVSMGWDLTGAAYITAHDFAILGGTSTANCPKVTMLLGAANVSGSFLFSGLMKFDRVEMNGYGSYTVYDAGAEQLTFSDCIVYGYGSCIPFNFVASGQIPGVTSALVTTQSPVHSMTDVVFQGAFGAVVFQGAAGVKFDFASAAAGGVAGIWFDTWMQAQAASGNIWWMTDNAAGAAGTSIQDCGSRKFAYEGNTTNPLQGVCSFGAKVCTNVTFEGYGGSGATGLTGPLFNFTAASGQVVNPLIRFTPSPSSPLSGNFFNCTGSLFGGHVSGNALMNTQMGVGSPVTPQVAGMNELNFIASGTDHTAIGSPTILGPQIGGALVVLSRLRGGNYVSTSSDGYLLAQTTASVGTSATAIIGLTNYGAMVGVTGVSGGSVFADLLWVTFAAATPIVSATSQGGPAARTYSVASGTLKLAMASGSYNIQATHHGFGAQA